MQTQSTLTNQPSRRYLQGDFAQILVKKTLFIPQRESRFACSFLRFNYFAIIFGLTNSIIQTTLHNDSTTPHGHVCLVAAPYFVWTSMQRVLCTFATDRALERMAGETSHCPSETCDARNPPKILRRKCQTAVSLATSFALLVHGWRSGWTWWPFRRSWNWNWRWVSLLRRVMWDFLEN